ncbi:flavin reductase family protein [Croceibacterium ferulae]|uniref:flavin reductase family protein n=1 Tax=Croceibacterium ferulae TaxID=1854641 RepID=UPI000EAC8CBE|nr:flavin reductase family protein [Croceibacterium ferulae]
MAAEPVDALTFRHIMGHYPTGVCAITACTAAGMPLGMIVGSFASVSLDPVLVGFFPARSSSTWPQIAATGRFCVNVLADTQEELCKILASKLPDRFAGIAHGKSPGGAPLLDGAIAWFDCKLHDVVDAGDHLLVLGAVETLDTHHAGRPLLFHQGEFVRMAAR